MVIVDFIVLDLCLNAIVNGHEFNNLTYLTPGYTVPSRMLVMNYLKQHHSIVKLKLQKSLCIRHLAVTTKSDEWKIESNVHVLCTSEMAERYISTNIA